MKCNVWIARGLTATVAVSCGAMLLMSEPSAQAWPKYATAEKKPCSYCHVKTSGGGARNPAGAWYQKHNHSFAEYTPEKAAAEYGGGAAEGATATPTPAPTPKPTPKPVVKKPVTKTTKKPAKKP